MTGAGKASAQYNGKTIQVFVKTLNSKQMDLSVRLPYIYREREIEIRGLVAERVIRGKVDLSITVDEASEDLSGVQRINEVALRYYVEQLNKISLSTPIEFPTMESLLRLPGVLVSGEATRQEELSDEEWQVLRAAIEEALEELRLFRKQEGVMLEVACGDRIRTIGRLLEDVAAPESERIPAIRQRLEVALSKLSLDALNSGRLEQELIYYIEKLDINEEKDRLRHHLGYFLEVMGQESGAQGKTLSFIAQEIGREINTLGSKSNNAEMQQLVVKMKDELEQIKEQSLNIL